MEFGFDRAGRLTGELTSVLDHLAAGRQAALDRLFQFLALPSISTDPAYHPACVAAAEWCAGALREIGFEARVEPTRGKPMVVGHWRAPGGGSPSRVLFYGHYDVQPPDPLDEWTAPPFEPRLVADHGSGERIVARGASDDKGQVMTFIEACRSWLATHGRLPVDVTVLLEGEEESGSPSLPAFLESHGEELKADLCLVCDTGQWDEDTPSITAFLRGLAFAEITVTGPSRDLHSGLYGGPARNPIRVLAELLAALHDERGRVTIPGFYDDVVTPPPEQLAEWRGLGFDVECVSRLHWTDHAGRRSGLKRARAALVAAHGGDQRHLRRLHRTRHEDRHSVPRHGQALLPPRAQPGAAQEFSTACTASSPSGCRPIAACPSPAKADRRPSASISPRRPFKRRPRALEQEWGKAPVILGCGASIPIVESFRSRLGHACALGRLRARTTTASTRRTRSIM